MSIKYFGVYNGPSYGGGWGDTEQMPGFGSIEEAKHYYSSMQGGYVFSDEYKENADGEYVLWERRAYALTPATSYQDTMYLYGAEKTEWGTYIRHGECSYVLSVGERGGVKVDKY